VLEGREGVVEGGDVECGKVVSVGFDLSVKQVGVRREEIKAVVALHPLVLGLVRGEEEIVKGYNELVSDSRRRAFHVVEDDNHTGE
jgi:hypothetical protein